jgi:hypothetical protein
MAWRVELGTRVPGIICRVLLLGHCELLSSRRPLLRLSYDVAHAGTAAVATVAVGVGAVV